MTRSRIYLVAIIIVAIIAGGYRIYAINRLPLDIDEPIYLNTGIEYANYLRNGQYGMISQTQSHAEHPAFYKFVYGVALLPQEPVNQIPLKNMPVTGALAKSNIAKWAMTDRTVAAILGTSAAVVLAIVNPLAGLFLALETISVKFTSEIYLEALPLLTSLLTAITYLRWFEGIQHAPANKQKPDARWLIASALFLGMTAASKYDYCVVAVGITIHFLVALLQKKVPMKTGPSFLGWVGLSLLFFLVFDPYLWPDIWNRLMTSIAFHFHLQGRIYELSLTQKKAYPAWQPLVWLFSPLDYYNAGPRAIYKINIDPLIGILAVIGLPRFILKRRLFFYWFLVGIIFLFLWGSKWAHYTLIIMAPFCLAASEGGITIWILVKHFFPNIGTKFAWLENQGNIKNQV